jgi:hypothetical protein
MYAFLIRPFLRSLLLAVLLPTVIACTTLTSDIKVETFAQPDTNPSAYKSYAWAGSAQVVFDPVGQWEQPTLDTDEEVRFVINRELRNSGLVQVETDPDLYVGFAAGVDTSVLELKEDPDNKEKMVPTNVPKAALVIAMIDARTGYTVWLGYAEGNAQNQQSIENIRKRIDFAVTEILAPYQEMSASETTD